MNPTLTDASKPVRADDLARHIREHISEKQLQPGDRLPTFAAIRERFGAATNTVDRAYAKLASQGVVERRPGSGIYVAESSPTGTGIVGYLGEGFTGDSNYWDQCTRGVREGLLHHNIDPLLLSGPPASGTWSRVDGIICHTASPFLENRPPGLPLVSMLHRVPGAINVVADDYGGMMTATRHLIDLGHRRIGSLMLQDDFLGCQRHGGYHGALRMAGVTPSPQWSRALQGNFGENSFSEVARQIVTKWIRDDWSAEGLTALVCHNDETAIGAMQAFNEAGLQVPADVSVIGFDGTEVSELSDPSLTTVKVPLHRIGRRAADELCEQIDNQESRDEETIALPVELIERDSTARV